MRISDWSSDVCSSDLELRSGTQASVEVRPTYGLTDAEVERVIEESFEFAEEDVRARMLIEARNEAGTVLRAPEKELVQSSEERRAGKECVRTCRSRWAKTNKKTTINQTTKSRI